MFIFNNDNTTIINMDCASYCTVEPLDDNARAAEFDKSDSKYILKFVTADRTINVGYKTMVNAQKEIENIKKAIADKSKVYILRYCN